MSSFHLASMEDSEAEAPCVYICHNFEIACTPAMHNP